MSNPTRQKIERVVADAIREEQEFSGFDGHLMAKAALKALEQWLEIVPESQEPRGGDVVRFELTMMGGAGGCIAYHKYYDNIESELGGAMESSEILQTNNKPALIIKGE